MPEARNWIPDFRNRGAFQVAGVFICGRIYALMG
jgi:hypothetical protein